MKVAIHQPHYWPWLPYLLKIAESDLFIVLDTVSFEKNGLQNRNRIKTAQGAQWLTVPVKHKLGEPLTEIVIDPAAPWRRKHWNSIALNYRKASAFAEYAPELETLYARKWTSLVELNVRTTELLLAWMGVKTKLVRASALSARGRASELVLNLCLAVKATTYVSGVGAKAYLDEAAFARAGIELAYRPPVLPASYPQLHPAAGFLPDLSALDLILNCGSRWADYVKEIARCAASPALST